MISWLKSCLLGLFILSLAKSTKAIDCYQCSSIRNITDCHNLVQCNVDEYCFSETAGLGIYTTFTLGCRSRHTCLTSQSSTTESAISIIGRAAKGTDCSQCCAVDACNKQLCTTGSKALDTFDCQDDPAFNCATVASTFNICGDIQHAKLKCKHFCGLCNIVDGHWSDWHSWSRCSVSCGPGTQTRIRLCNNPPPSDGGLNCVGQSDQHVSCNLRSCPEQRDRSCSNPYPGPDGDPCWGDSRDYRACFYRACADGYWSRWTNWGSCSSSCLGGLQSRRRTCTNPSPSKFGHDCVGNSEETKACNTLACPTPFIRLVGGSNSRSGRVEVKYGGVWGTVCDDSFNTNAARVVCRSLGYSTNSASYNSYNSGSGRIWLDDISCTGSEKSLEQCNHLPWGKNDCSHNEDVSVSC